MIKQAFVSGELAKAIYFDGSKYFVLSQNSSEPSELRMGDLPLLLNSGAEFKELALDQLELRSIRSALEFEAKGQRALFFVLAGLDSNLSDFQPRAAVAAEELLQDARTQGFVRNRLLARPAPRGVLQTVPRINVHTPVLNSLYKTAFDSQSAIRDVNRAWEVAAAECRRSKEEIPQAEQLLTDSGFIAALVECVASGKTEELNDIVKEYALDPRLRRSIPGLVGLLNSLREKILAAHPPRTAAGNVPQQVEALNQAAADVRVASQKSSVSAWARENRALLFIILVLAGTALTALAAWRLWKIPSIFPPIKTDINGRIGVPELGILIRKLITTILVYFMQFGFIAFEAGAVRLSYRRVSAVKNLIVFSVAFLSYICVGWHIQLGAPPSMFSFLRDATPPMFSLLLDVAFNAGFASTVALIIANTITERGTVLVNVLCAVMAAGFAYPLLARLAFEGGLLYQKFGFVDTAGGLVVHVLGGALGLSAALLVGPRAKRRAWLLLGQAHVEKENDNTPLTVIGAFFLWFGWLGFNSGSALDWDKFLVAFFNTSVGASVGGLVGLVVAVVNKQLLIRGRDRAHKGVQIEIEIAVLERVVLGMMGGLVAVTANASLVKPWQAFIEASLGGTLAIVGSALLVHFRERLDDPLGAIATHGLAGTAGVLLTGAFVREAHLSVQFVVWAGAVAMGLALGAFPCLLLWGVEVARKRSEPWLYGTLLRLTAHNQRTGRTGTEYWNPAESIERARAYLRECSGLPKVIEGGDQRWIEAVRVLALSETENAEVTKELSEALDQVLASKKDGSLEEQTAIAAIQARADFRKLPTCVRRGLDHRGKTGQYRSVTPWDSLSPLYAETLIRTISDLAESFAAEYRALSITPRPEEDSINLEAMIDGFGKACIFLKQVGDERSSRLPIPGVTLSPDLKLSRLAWRKFTILMKLPWYGEIIEKFDQLPA